VADASLALGWLADFHYDYPSKQLKLVGVTGTNGKTTVATLLHRLAGEMGYKAGLCSTVANFVNQMAIAATHTTPDALTMQGLLRQMVDAGCEYCFMEVSSHSVVQNRIAGLRFAGGIFTNITHDHLDYHVTFDAYLKAKKGFFDGLEKEGFALVNADDKNGAVMLQNCKAVHKTFSLREIADFRVKVIESLFEGMHLEINGKELWTPFIGRFNAANLVAVYGAALLLNWKQDEVLISLSKLLPVDGRFETIRSRTGITAVVDYAHTPDALQNVLEALNQIRQSENDLITVVGAGGDRDPYKRPIMAAEAVKGSTKVILTADNPRSEDPETIIEQMMEGVEFNERIKVISITNRKEAIRTACSMAKKGDVILVAGKGHETYQEVKGVRSHFDDREIIRDFFEQL
jgi:UDP-N-acetylmuramoyl-L-alanyl-D-glutamate--2,6-diaminopimelate ligase